jgi:hypothetical protein
MDFIKPGVNPPVDIAGRHLFIEHKHAALEPEGMVKKGVIPEDELEDLTDGRTNH